MEHPVPSEGAQHLLQSPDTCPFRQKENSSMAHKCLCGLFLADHCSCIPRGSSTAEQLLAAVVRCTYSTAANTIQNTIPFSIFHLSREHLHCEQIERMHICVEAALVMHQISTGAPPLSSTCVMHWMILSCCALLSSSASAHAIQRNHTAPECQVIW